MSYRVRFLPEDRTWEGGAPVPLSLAAAACDILLEQPCGARGTCGRCRVQLRPAPPATAPELDVLGRDAAAAGWRLGCRIELAADTAVEVPFASRLVAHKTFGDADLLTPGFQRVAASGCGIALDVGSTTLAAALVEMSSGDVLATGSALNPQVRFGADIMSRIAFARSRATGAAELHAVLAHAIGGLLARVRDDAGVGSQDVAWLAVAGNPTMLHSLRALPLAPLGEAPFQGAAYGAAEVAAGALGLDLPGTRAYVLPGIGAHVGADAVAALVATGLDRPGPARLLLDLGTNTELVLAAGGALYCTSAAAGPAFEGASIRHGMRAVPGAIEQVRCTASGQLLVHTIGDAPPVGICGSGLLDAAAELLRAGVIAPSGRLRAAQELPPPFAAHLIESESGRSVRLSDSGGRTVLLTAADIRELQLVKASIGAALELLLREAGVQLETLEQILIAGAFGNYIRVESAQALGLLPRLPVERVHFVGNAAGAGARLALVDRGARARAERTAAAARFVDLAGRARYQEAFVGSLAFPEPGAAA